MNILMETAAIFYASYLTPYPLPCNKERMNQNSDANIREILHRREEQTGWC